jgi:hypothetical protein
MSQSKRRRETDKICLDKQSLVRYVTKKKAGQDTESGGCWSLVSPHSTRYKIAAYRDIQFESYIL